MFTRILIATIFVLGFAGCATTGQPKVNQDQIQNRVTDLEKKLEEKDAEIVDLQYEVKDLSSKVGTDKSSSRSSDEEPSVSPSAKKSSTGDEIIRVNVDPEAVQSALKGAGVYTGKIDGKIGAGTKAAIVKFQKEHGLKADGVLGRKTWEELKTYAK